MNGRMATGPYEAGIPGFITGDKAPGLTPTGSARPDGTYIDRE